MYGFRRCSGPLIFGADLVCAIFDPPSNVLTTRPTHRAAMPRVVQPGGLSQRMRVRYNAHRKLSLLASAKRIMEKEGLTLRRAAERLQVCHSLFVRWQQQRAANNDPILAMLKSKRMADQSVSSSISNMPCSGMSLRSAGLHRPDAQSDHQGIIPLPRVQRKALRCKAQCRQAFLACPFTCESYGHARNTAQAQ
jgi:hypothetical protein